MQTPQSHLFETLTLANQQISRWHAYNSQAELNHAALTRILAAAAAAIQARGKFLIVLAGGGTPKTIYELLSKAEARWANWFVFHNDDRCLPPSHHERNSLMAREAWLNHVAIPETQILDIPAELGNVAGAKAYAETLKNVGTFDLVILGLGEDGHTASLFPGQSVNNTAFAVPVFNAPKPPAERITMSQTRLNNTNEVMFLVTGSGKQAAVNDWRSGVAIPATLIAPENGVDVYTFGVKLNVD